MPGAPDKDRALHQLIVQQDDLAFARLCDTLYEKVFAQLRSFYRQHSGVDEALLLNVVTDTFLNYFRSPQRYQPDKQSLERFLTMDAEGDLLNAIEKNRRLTKKFQKAVELDAENGNSWLRDPDTPWLLLLKKEQRESLQQRLAELFTTPTDRAIAELMLEGERSTRAYALLLNITDLNADDQRKEVKRNKDRIDKIFKRKLKRDNDT